MVKLKVYTICSVTLMCLFLFGGLLYAAFQEQPYLTTVAEQPAYKRVIIIDPGHGGEDSGAVANGLLEKDINLKIACKLRDMLQSCGYDVIMTRDSDISIYDSTASTTREKKVSDLKNRVAMVNANPDNLLISIHQNKFEQSQYDGTQLFYSTNHPRSERMASEIRKSVTGLLQPENKRELKPADSNIYLLDHAEVPAVIVECGFLSNEAEAARLSDDSYQQQMAFAVCCGILSFDTE